MIKRSTQKSAFRASVNQYISEFIHPLRDKSITQFAHSMTFGNNEITTLGNSDVSFYFNKYKVPIFCCDKSGRILEEGIYTNKILQTTYRECADMLPLVVNVGKRFGMNYGKHSLHIVEREKDCQHLYTLYFDLEENEFLYWSLNNGQFIHDVLEKYKYKGRDIILEGKDKENICVRDDLSEFDLTRLQDYKRPQSKLFSILHKDLKTPVFLSKQQTKCLLLLFHGKTAKMIAQELNLSPRTVEFYLATVREMLGCASSKELIASYYDSIRQYEHGQIMSRLG